MCYNKIMKHFLVIKSKHQPLRPYAKFSMRIFNQCLSLAKTMQGLTIIHINSTASGGGVAELLKNQIPLENGLGLDSRWLVLRASKQFFFITKKIHNLLQGQKGFLSEPEKSYYLNQLKPPAKELQGLINKISSPLVIILHDPQVLPLIDYLPRSVKTIVRLHIDLSASNKTMLQSIKPFLEKANIVVVSNKLFKPKNIVTKKIVVNYPAINPFSYKNRSIDKKQALKLFKFFGIDTNKPIAVQVSRFDLWKDPAGVIEAYYLAKKEIPNLQLVLEGVIEAKDDPEAQSIYNQLKIEYQNDPDIFIHGVKTLDEKTYQIWVNALQRRADVVIQKSLREGFGLTATEALWKSKAVIGGNAAGIKVQIKNGQNGFIVNSSAKCAKRIVQLLKNPQLARRLGRRSHEGVRKKFLFNSLIYDFLKIYKRII